jgi:hypothetical protein
MVMITALGFRMACLALRRSMVTASLIGLSPS